MSRDRAFPHPLTLLVGGVFLAAALTWLVPAGRYERREDPLTGRQVVVAGTYRAVPARPVGPFATLVKIPKGLIGSADVVFFVFLVGGAFAVVDRTGVLRWVVDRLVRRLERRQFTLVAGVCLVFALGGVFENLQEEIIPLVPVMLLLCRRLGFDPLSAVAMSIGAASVGSAFSPVNPFQVVVAQKLAGLPPTSAALWRTAFLVPALAVWTWATWRHASRPPLPAASSPAGSPGPARAPDAAGTAPSDPGPGQAAAAGAPVGAGRPDAGEPRGGSGRAGLVLGLVAAAFAVFVCGVVGLHWGFEEMAATFFAMGILAGLVGGLGVGGTTAAFVEGFREMTLAALLIGFARAIYVVLDDGQVVDTLINGLFVPLGRLPVAWAAGGMVLGQVALHFPVPSLVGQAALTLPVLVSVADLLHLSRQVVVLAFHYGAGLAELIIPTNGALLAILGAAGVRYEAWLRFVWPWFLLLLILGLASVALALAAGLP